MSDQTIYDRIGQRLAFLYGADRAPAILEDIRGLVEQYRPRLSGRPARAWRAADTFLITYGDSVVRPGEAPLQTLRGFLDRHAPGLSMVHLLPFYPYTSDDGFAVSDFRELRPELGTWDDVADLAAARCVVFDGVINHVSSESVYMRGYLGQDPAYADFFIDLPPDTDTRSVLRTRNLPLLHDYTRADGSTCWLWTTFSRDQVDLNFSNPRVLVEVLDVLLTYAERGAGMIRLDAIPYLWKELGTSCAHLPQTHEAIKLIRDVYDLAAPHVLLLTETNVPHHENVTYFGDAGDEAQLIYNFALPPLILHALVTGDGSYLSGWARQVRRVSPRATYLNITATHDGIGMRPTEGILPEPDRQMLCNLAKAHHGDITGKRNADGSVSPYELNLNYFDAVNDPDAAEPLALQIDRFLLSQTIPFSFIGIPGVYIHSLVGSRNDLDGVRRTGRARSINRAQLDADGLDAELAESGSLRQRVLSRFQHLMAARAAEPALHPDADQEVLDAGPALFAVRRFTPAGEELTAVHNLTGLLQRFDGAGAVVDVLTGEALSGAVELAPYAARWLKPAE